MRSWGTSVRRGAVGRWGGKALFTQQTWGRGVAACRVQVGGESVYHLGGSRPREQLQSPTLSGGVPFWVRGEKPRSTRTQTTTTVPHTLSAFPILTAPIAFTCSGGSGGSKSIVPRCSSASGTLNTARRALSLRPSAERSSTPPSGGRVTL
eukprot:scaffold22270_cov73-Isochrysis_galbana.AAC.1